MLVLIYIQSACDIQTQKGHGWFVSLLRETARLKVAQFTITKKVCTPGRILSMEHRFRRSCEVATDKTAESTVEQKKRMATRAVKLCQHIDTLTQR